MRLTTACSFAMFVVLLSPRVDAEDVSLEKVPPVVVKTVPESGTDGIDPQITQIEVTFSKDMTDKSWSWATLSNESFPTLAGEPSYQENKRTSVLPVKLESGKTYAIWVNSQKFRNFKDADGQAAVPYLLVFKTKAAN
jgi:hypothetical protein